jgi:macrolide-specific efflux system membrane fusion protein
MNDAESASPKRPVRKKRRGLKKLIVLALLIAAAGGGWHVYKQHFGKDAKAAAPQVQVVEAGNIEDVVTAQGKLEPKEYVDVGAQVSGQLKKLYVEIGDVVKKGDPIADIDPDIYQARVDSDEARLKTLNAQLAQQQATETDAQTKLKRNEDLFKAQAISREMLEDAQTTAKVAEAQVNAIKAQIEEQNSTLEGDKANLSYTKIFAPMDGTVVLQSVREGQTVNSSQQAPTIVQLADLDIMTVRAQVAEADVSRIKPDMDVYFTTLGSSEQRWQGKVRQILPSPEVVNDVVLYNVLVDVDNKDRRLMTGMSTQMFFVLGAAKDVPVIPVSALGKRLKKKDSGGMAYVVRKMDGKKETPVIVQTGLSDRTNVEVKSGLAVGDRIVSNVPAPAQQGANGGSRRGGGRMMGGPRL